jgi:hypothetical protein
MQDFQFTRIVPRRGKGVLFADGTQMLQRQGIANTINGNLGKGLSFRVSERFPEAAQIRLLQ